MNRFSPKAHHSSVRRFLGEILRCNGLYLNIPRIKSIKREKILADKTADRESFEWALLVLNNWRSCHGYPINTFQATLRNKLKSIDSDALVAQRLKRAPSIIGKLERQGNMQLARMQDIGGLRAVVRTLKQVRILEASYQSSRFAHELVSENDYIATPKSSGYRSIHLIYRYHNNKAPAYEGLLVELQMRTKLQHIWATAVETMGTFLDHALKSSEGPKEWLNFFSLVGSAFAHLEKCPAVPNYECMTAMETYREVTKVSNSLNVRNRLTAYTVVTNAITRDRKMGSYHLIILNLDQKTVQIQSFGVSRLEEANERYMLAETQSKNGESTQAVLVATSSLEMLRRAYPNFFLDTSEFLNKLRVIESMATRIER